MKKSLVIILLSTLAFAMHAQSSCQQQKACCAAKATQTSLTETQLKAAVLLASQDEEIEVRKNEANGETQFVRKQVCPMSGAVSYVDVQFDTEHQQFVNVAPVTAEVAADHPECAGKPCDKPCAGKECPKGCCAGKASASSTPQTMKTSQTMEIKPGLKTENNKKAKIQ